jgi:hypothetical protein
MVEEEAMEEGVAMEDLAEDRHAPLATFVHPLLLARRDMFVLPNHRTAIRLVTHPAIRRGIRLATRLAIRPAIRLVTHRPIHPAIRRNRPPHRSRRGARR